MVTEDVGRASLGDLALGVAPMERVPALVHFDLEGKAG
jgi:hypothetical protein